jgi:nucleotide-binding universal stress UspA family protein
MLQKVLVALDCSDNALQVFETTIALAKSMARELMLLHVLSPNDEASPSLPIRVDSSAFPLV